MRRLSVDPGAKRVGLAWSDDDCAIALPLKTLEVRDGIRDKTLIARLQAEISELSVQEVVIGLPLMLDGSEGEGARRSRLLATQLEKAAGVPVILWDERLTTVAAQRELRGSGVSARHQKGKIDQVAATILLQSYLDANTETAWDVWDVDQVHLNAPPDAPPKPGSRRRRGSFRER